MMLRAASSTLASSKTCAFVNTRVEAVLNDTYDYGGLSAELEHTWLEVLGSFSSNDPSYTVATSELERYV